MNSPAAFRALAFATAASTAALCFAQDAFEPNNTSNAARTIGAGLQDLSIHTVGDVDWFRFTIGSSGATNFRLETDGPAGGDTQLWLYSSDQTSVVNFISVMLFDDDSGNGSYSLITAPALSTGTYFVEVREKGNDAILPAYTLRMSWTEGGIAADSFEPDDEPFGAATLANDVPQNRTLHVSGDQDWSKFILPRGGDNVVATMSRNGAAGNSALWLYGPNNATTVIAQDTGSGSSGTSRLTQARLGPGTYYLRGLTSGGGVMAAYTLRVAWGAPGSGGLSFLSQPSSSVATPIVNVAFFGVSANGPTPYTYQWRKNGTAIAGATQQGFNLSNVTTADVGVYAVVVSNASGAITSNDAVLSFHAASGAPTIVVQPVNRSVESGEGAGFAVAAYGAATLTYQWRKNGVAIAGATAATYRIATTSAADAASYSVVVSNGAGSVTSAAATLAVTAPPVLASRLINVSTRGLVPAGGALTPGFVLRGTGSKNLVIRGIGPTLGEFGLASALADPRLEAMAQGSSAALATNDNWGGATSLGAAFTSVGAFALSNGSRDAALQTSLPVNAGGYSARVTSNAPGASGIALAEVYDADPDSSASRLVNVSTLGFVGTGDAVLTAGFVVRGNVAKTVLIRAIGPGLAQFGVGGLLADPQFNVTTPGQTALVTSSQDWGGRSDLKAAFAAVGAFALQDNSRDAAEIASLAPGNYTVQVTGAGGATGNALVEVYDLDP